MANKVKTNPDIKVTNNGSTWSFHVLTEAGRELAQQMIDGSGLKIV